MCFGERTVSEINNSKLVCQRVSASLECPWARRANNEKSHSSTTPRNMFPINTSVWISNLSFLQCVLAIKWPMYSWSWINNNIDAKLYHWLALLCHVWSSVLCQAPQFEPFCFPLPVNNLIQDLELLIMQKLSELQSKNNVNDVCYYKRVIIFADYDRTAWPTNRFFFQLFNS